MSVLDPTMVALVAVDLATYELCTRSPSGVEAVRMTQHPAVVLMNWPAGDAPRVASFVPVWMDRRVLDQWRALPHVRFLASKQCTPHATMGVVPTTAACPMETPRVRPAFAPREPAAVARAVLASAPPRAGHLALTPAPLAHADSDTEDTEEDPDAPPQPARAQY